MRRCLGGTAIVVSVALAVWGCGGGDGADADGGASGGGTSPGATAAPDPRQDEREIRRVADEFYEAFLKLDGDAACSLLSEAAAQQLVEDPDNEEYGDTCPEILAGGAAVITAFYGEDPEIRITDIEVTGDRATATSSFAGEQEQLTFEREGGEWKVGPESSNADPSGGVDRATADSWPEKWCDVELGMTRSEVQQIMGAPTATHTGELSQDEWDAFQWSFTAFYRYRTDIDDPAEEPAYQLQVNESELTAADRTRITCAFTRS